MDDDASTCASSSSGLSTHDSSTVRSRSASYFIHERLLTLTFRSYSFKLSLYKFAASAFAGLLTQLVPSAIRSRFRTARYLAEVR